MTPQRRRGGSRHSGSRGTSRDRRRRNPRPGRRPAEPECGPGGPRGEYAGSPMRPPAPATQKRKACRAHFSYTSPESGSTEVAGDDIFSDLATGLSTTKACPRSRTKASARLIPSWTGLSRRPDLRRIASCHWSRSRWASRPGDALDCRASMARVQASAKTSLSVYSSSVSGPAESR